MDGRNNIKAETARQKMKNISKLFWDKLVETG